MPQNVPPFDPETLRRENEERKRELEQDFGAVFGFSDPDVPPGVENQFLRNILEFEQHYQSREQIAVYDFIGRPSFRLPADLVSEDECRSELDRLLALLETNGIVLSVLGQYSPSLIYRFVTEELFQIEMDNIRIPGFTSNFIYEEFHPNHALELEDRVREFFDGLSRLDVNWGYFAFMPVVKDSQGKKLTEKNLQTRLKDFQNRFSMLKTKRLIITGLDFDLDKAWGQVTFSVMLEGRLRDDQPWQAGGESRMEFAYDLECWCIARLDFPEI